MNALFGNPFVKMSQYYKSESDLDSSLKMLKRLDKYIDKQSFNREQKIRIVQALGELNPCQFVGKGR